MHLALDQTLVHGCSDCLCRYEMKFSSTKFPWGKGMKLLTVSAHATRSSLEAKVGFFGKWWEHLQTQLCSFYWDELTTGAGSEVSFLGTAWFPEWKSGPLEEGVMDSVYCICPPISIYTWQLRGALSVVKLVLNLTYCLPDKCLIGGRVCVCMHFLQIYLCIFFLKHLI